MADPTYALKVEFAWASVPFAETPTWTDETADVISVRTMRGRTQPFTPFQSGTAQITLRNKDRKYEPGNTSGVRYPNIKLRKRCRVTMLVTNPDATTEVHPIFDGFITQMPRRTEGFNHDQAVFTLNDAFAIFAKTPMPSVWEREVVKGNGATPQHWYRMGEVGGSVMRDSIGGKNARWIGDTTRSSSSSLVIYDEDGSMSMDRKTNSFADSGPGSLVPPYSVGFWFRSSTIPTGSNTEHILWSDDLYINVQRFRVYLQGSTEFSPERFGWTVRGGRPNDSFRRIGFTNDLQLYDGLPHLIFLVNTGSTTKILFDGVDRTTVLAESGFPAEQPGLIHGGLRHITPTQDGVPIPYMMDELMYFNYDVSGARAQSLFAAGTTPYDGDRSDVRLTKLLDIYGVPAVFRSLDIGDTFLGPADIASRDLLNSLQDVELSEAGSLYMTRAGLIRFRKRQGIALPPLVVSQATFSNAPGGIPYSDPVFDYDADRIINKVRVGRLDGTVVELDDLVSQTDHGITGFEQTDLATKSDMQVYDFGMFVLTNNAYPQEEIESITLSATAGPDARYHMLRRELEDRVTVVDRTIAGAVSPDKMVMIQGIEQTIGPGANNWTTKFNLAPAPPSGGGFYLVLDNAVSGKLDSNNRIGF